MLSTFQRYPHIFIACILGLGLLFTPACRSGSEGGRAAPDFSLEDLSGELVSLSDFRGKVVLVDFWATWCPPCRQSIPELVQLQKKYREKGLVVLGISLDDPQMISSKSLQAFGEAFGINYNILRGNQKVVLDFFGKAETAIPTMFVINREGFIVDKHVGFRPGSLEESLKRHL
ncbi:MAG: TlpA family protein disulfide reductase [Deltaproteobacteria bacterium]|nr:TlpA family protein disulfide reductase [Deltaproteobacteria bacterium]MBW2017210.1 TlpA family protein disulfide reductase [Deltaproteobacteria bacterium]MBW2129284.1 TlpA family protein disulfide reductase [Deltaproteobacteria bacterium]MBW2303984.1 TlpA family protein disulfide reductase [Deltaproteobacteria bacterium]